jgi:hypothetical protein
VSLKSALVELVVVTSVSVEEGDLAVVDIEDAMVRDGDAMGVAGKVGEDFVRAIERGLGVDDPVLPVQSVDELVEPCLGGE